MIVLFYLPLLVSLGSGAILSDSCQKINTISGNISYPLYMTHYPFVWIFLTYLSVEKPEMAHLTWVIPMSVLLLILLAYLVVTFLDFPIRRYLTDKLKAV
ncbi:MAG: hypothetical protein ABI850_14005 [Flavobacterium sp.]